ncbi:MAG: DUF5320 domain-containing protein [Tissierellaceae bacterium]
MPRGDGRGPMGYGPMSGRGMGYCARAYGPGPRMGFGRGRGFGPGFGPGYNAEPYYSRTDKELLEEQKEILKDQLEYIEKQLEDL